MPASRRRGRIGAHPKILRPSEGVARQLAERDAVTGCRLPGQPQAAGLRRGLVTVNIPSTRSHRRPGYAAARGRTAPGRARRRRLWSARTKLASRSAGSRPGPCRAVARAEGPVAGLAGGRPRADGEVDALEPDAGGQASGRRRRRRPAGRRWPARAWCRSRPRGSGGPSTPSASRPAEGAIVGWAFRSAMSSSGRTPGPGQAGSDSTTPMLTGVGVGVEEAAAGDAPGAPEDLDVEALVRSAGRSAGRSPRPARARTSLTPRV